MVTGYARVDITPELGVELAGYGFYLKRKCVAVHDRLYARAVAMKARDNHSLIVSCDLLGLSAECVATVKADLWEKCGVRPESVLLCCTHTHSGPAAGSLRACGVMSREYVQSLKPRIVQAGVEAVSNLAEVENIAYAELPVEGVAANRTYGDAGPLDANVRTLRINRRTGRPITIVNFACHPVANGVSDQVSADFPGQVVSRIEADGADCMYVSGFCGDINPIGDRGRESMEKHGNAVANTAARAMSKARLVDTGKMLCAAQSMDIELDIPSEDALVRQMVEVRDKLEHDPSDRESLCSLSWMIDAINSIRQEDFSHSVHTYVQAIMVDNVALVAFPGETFTAFGLMLRERFPGLHLMTVNTANGVIGYIPTSDEFDREGYASHLSARLYNTFTFKKGFGEQICATAETLLSRMSADPEACQCRV